MNLKIVPEDGYDTIQEKIGQLQRSKDESRPMAERKRWGRPRQLMTKSFKISPWGVEAIKTSLLASLTGILMSNLNPSGAKDRAEAVKGRGFYNRGQKRPEYGHNGRKGSKYKVLKAYYFFTREKEHTLAELPFTKQTN